MKQSTSLLFYWLRLSGVLFCIFAVALTSGTAIRNAVELRSIGRPYTATRDMAHKMMRKIGSIMRPLTLVIASLFIGWVVRDSWAFRHTYVLNNVVVTATPGETVYEDGVPRRLAYNEYYLQRREEPVGQAFPFPFCPDFIPKMERGTRVQVVVYEHRTVPEPCHEVGRPEKNGIIFYP